MIASDRLLLVALRLLLFLRRWTFIAAICPCEFSNNRNDSNVLRTSAVDSRLIICTSHENEVQLLPLLRTASTSDRLQFISPYNGIESTKNFTCDVILEIVVIAPTASTSRELCPQQCSPSPILYFAHFLLLHDEHKWDSFEDDYAPVCSLNVKSDLLVDWKSNSIARAKYRSFQTYLLHTLAWRRYLECREDVFLSTFAKSAHIPGSNKPSKSPPSFFTHLRRRVLSLVIWIGSQQNYRIIEGQALMLYQENYHTSLSSVIGWAATDELYPSKPGSVKCLSSNKRYGGFLTNSAVNFMPKGWGRAQRRPLRALSHVLLLFDPQFIVIADDDTLFNFPLFRIKYLPMLLPPYGNWSHHAMIIGEMMGRTGPQGHLSMHGIFIGGSGYILNQPLLQQLHGNKIYSFGLTMNSKQQLSSDYIIEDIYRSKTHIWHLSVLKEGIEMTSKHCPEASQQSCIVINKDDMKPTSSEKAVAKGGIDYVTPKGRNEQIEIAVRVVDFCANLMANEHTCQHSDHSLGRCILYAAAAQPIHSYCHDVSNPPRQNETINDVIGMCFTTPVCDLNEQITCHRYQAANRSRKPLAHVRIGVGKTSKKGGHYRVYSSVLNGSETETFMARRRL